MRKILLALLILISTVSIAQVGDIMNKRPTNYVNDYENIFTSDEEAKLNSMIESYEKSTSIQISVVTIDSIFETEAEIKDYADRLGEKWGVGSSELDNGLMVLISVSSRKWAISVGYGLEALYTDVKSGQLADKYFIPNFRAGNYFKGVQEFLVATMDEIGHEGYEQLIEKERIAEEERKQQAREFGMGVLYFLGVGAFLALIIYLIVLAVRKRKRYIELRDRINRVHNEIILRQEKLVKTIGKVPSEIKDEYTEKTKYFEVSEAYYNNLVQLKENISRYQGLIKSTNDVITSILSEEKSIKEYISRSYPFCEDYLKEEMKSFLPDTKSNLFTDVEFTDDRYFKLRELNNSLSGKLRNTLKKIYNINSIISANQDITNKVQELKSSYESYKSDKKYLMNLPIGKRLDNLPRVDIEGHIASAEREITSSISALKSNNYKTANYHYGVYLTIMSVLAGAFSGVSDLVSSYKRSVNYIKSNKDNITDKLDLVKSEITKSGVRSSRKSTLKEINAKINKFNSSIALDIILAYILLKEILDGLDELYSDIKGDIRRKKDEDDRRRRRRNSSYGSGISIGSSSYGSYGGGGGSSFGGFGGGGFGGGGSSGSW